MKIQLKRSNVLENGSAKAPTAAQMEYGELAVNYNSSDPVIFIKDSSNGIIRLTNIQEIGDGQINIDPGVGLTASGQNGTANQSGNTVRILSVNTTWLDNYLNGWGTVNVHNGRIQIEAGDGLTATGDNGRANQSGDTTRTLTAVGDPGYGIDVTASGIRFGDNWSNIPALV